MKLDVKAIELAEQAEKIQEYEDWTLGDLKKYTDLSLRYSTAMTTVVNTMNETSIDTLGALDMSAYGF